MPPLANSWSSSADGRAEAARKDFPRVHIHLFDYSCVKITPKSLHLTLDPGYTHCFVS